jgi:signal transduction histidine kinase
VVKNLVENAIEHNDTDAPLVVAFVNRTDAGPIRMAISDNGPGVPETERAVLATGDEDPLEHGSGMGLWTVKWGITRLGGDISFVKNEPRGTVVQLTLPAASD